MKHCAHDFIAMVVKSCNQMNFCYYVFSPWSLGEKAGNVIQKTERNRRHQEDSKYAHTS